MSPQHAVLLDSATHADIALLARAWDVSEGEAVRRLIKHFQRSPAAASPTAASAPGEARTVAVHAIYNGHRVSGLYDPATESLTITAGPATGHYKSPSGAASAVLQALKPHVKPNRNGWSFWTVDESGELLQTLRHSST
ncbi:hypothetical protein [Streptomyces specialis]|uniref:hypothetical protein n=1 Tax=Streptomyces specialis TaxID=498367 RepID=UPI00073E2C18|nr:hypothetical protein [Streptomyces specialis]